MTTRRVARCSIYGDRPKVCEDYPKVDHWRPEVCTYYFINGERLGSCDCDAGACCATPREGGEPGGAHLPESTGGKPCRHLVWEEVAVKEASSPVYPTQRQELINIGLEYDGE